MNHLIHGRIGTNFFWKLRDINCDLPPVDQILLKFRSVSDAKLRYSMFYVHKLNSLWTSFSPVFVDSFAPLTCKNAQPSSRICPTFKISVKIGGLPPPRPVHPWPHPKLIFPHLPGECRYQAESSCIGWRGGLSLSNLVSSVNGWNKIMWKQLLNEVSFLFLYDFYVNKP
jgi:hypothetical protein